MSRVGIELTGDWKKALQKLANIEKNAEQAIALAALQSAHEMRAEMVGRIDGQKGFAPHAALTPFLRASGGSKILVATSTMRANIVVVPFPGGAFVGVARSAPKSRARIAEIQEMGAKIPITDRMRRYLHARARKAGAPPPPPGAAKVVIRIPARPFIGPVVERWREGGLLQARVTAALRRSLAL